ncbi:MAG TPA: HD domain-containing protein [bacterium]|nr:HD domain-containing protein [bacterium]
MTRVSGVHEVPPGTGRVIEIGGRAIALFNVGGTFYALDNTCTHRGGPLGAGRLDGNVVTCPWHGNRFDVTTGRVITGVQSVTTYAVEVRGADILVELPNTVPSGTRGRGTRQADHALRGPWMDELPGQKLTDRFSDAFEYAARLHAAQQRKGGGIPYVSHLLAVAALVLESGGDEDEAIAALLHDAAEDQGGRPQLEEIRRRFGDRVAAIVEGCTDTFQDPKPPWLERKKTYLRHLGEAPPDVRRVSLADKLHNARSMLADYRTRGEGLWGRFDGNRDDILWYYRSLVGAFRESRDQSMAQELERVVTELERLTKRR